MSFSKAKLRRFCDVTDENQTPGPGHYDPYNKNDRKLRSHLKTIDAHKSKTVKKNRTKIENVLKDKLTNVSFQNEILGIKNLKVDTKSVKKDFKISPERMEDDSDTNSNDLSPVVADDKFSSLMELVKDETSKVEQKMFEIVDKVVQQAQVHEQHFRELLKKKDLEIEQLKRQLQSFEVKKGDRRSNLVPLRA